MSPLAVVAPAPEEAAASASASVGVASRRTSARTSSRASHASRKRGNQQVNAQQQTATSQPQSDEQQTLTTTTTKRIKTEPKAKKRPSRSKPANATKDEASTQNGVAAATTAQDDETESERELDDTASGSDFDYDSDDCLYWEFDPTEAGCAPDDPNLDYALLVDKAYYVAKHQCDTIIDTVPKQFFNKPHHETVLPHSNANETETYCGDWTRPSSLLYEATGGGCLWQQFNADMTYSFFTRAQASGFSVRFDLPLHLQNLTRQQWRNLPKKRFQLDEYRNLDPQSGRLRYVGQLQLGLSNGRGTALIHSSDGDGVVLDGHYENDKCYSGRAVYESGDIYVGHFNSEERPHDENAVYFYAQSNVDGYRLYQGSMQNGFNEGKGHMLFRPNSQHGFDSYNGFWKDDRMIAKGRFTWNLKSVNAQQQQQVNKSDESSLTSPQSVDLTSTKDLAKEYFGQHNEGVRHGYGFCRWWADEQQELPRCLIAPTRLRPVVYVGNWSNGRMHGEGHFICSIQDVPGFVRCAVRLNSLLPRDDALLCKQPHDVAVWLFQESRPLQLSSESCHLLQHYIEGVCQVSSKPRECGQHLVRDAEWLLYQGTLAYESDVLGSLRFDSGQFWHPSESHAAPTCQESNRGMDTKSNAENVAPNDQQHQDRDQDQEHQQQRQQHHDVIEVD